MRITESKLRRIIREVMTVSDGKPFDATQLVLDKLNQSAWYERLKVTHKAATGENLPPLSPWTVESKNKNATSGTETTVFMQTLDPDKSDPVSLSMKVESTEKVNDYEYYVRIELTHYGRGTGYFDRPKDVIYSKTFTSSAAFTQFILNLDVQKLFQMGLKDSISLPRKGTPAVKEANFKDTVYSLKKMRRL